MKLFASEGTRRERRLAVALVVGLLLSASCGGSRDAASRDLLGTPDDRKMPGGIIGERVTLEEARSRAGYRIRLPQYHPGDPQIRGVFITPTGESAARMQVVVDLDDGSRLLFLPKDIAPDYERERRVQGFGRTLRIRRAPAFVFPPGESEGRHYVGTIKWYEDGVEHVINADRSEADLIRMAESAE